MYFKPYLIDFTSFALQIQMQEMMKDPGTKAQMDKLAGMAREL